MRALILRNHETTSSFGFYYGIPGSAIDTFLPHRGAIGGTNAEDGDNDNDNGDSDDNNDTVVEDELTRAKRRYLEHFERIGTDVEAWAHDTMRSSHEDRESGGWHEVLCAKALRKKFSDKNVPRTRQWVKWMTDSREEHAVRGDSQKHPCMKLVATIDAPFEIVCRYLSEKDRFREYNSLMVDQEDVEILTPHSKICWSQSKKLPLIQPRDFVTYCRHRWLNDGTQLVTNQACDHPTQMPTGPRAFSLRGATYISPCLEFPSERTKIVMLSHCNCGRDMPEWVVRTAVGLSAPIKPFAIIHRIDVGIKRAREELETAEQNSKTSSAVGASVTSATTTTTTTTTTTASPTLDPVRSSRPAGIAQMGYACFWPEGGGLVDQKADVDDDDDDQIVDRV